MKYLLTVVLFFSGCLPRVSPTNAGSATSDTSTRVADPAGIIGQSANWMAAIGAFSLAACIVWAIIARDVKVVKFAIISAALIGISGVLGFIADHMEAVVYTVGFVLVCGVAFVIWSNRNSIGDYIKDGQDGRIGNENDC